MKRLLYLFDDINYRSGAQTVAFLQIRSLRSRYRVDVFSLCKPLERPCIEQSCTGQDPMDGICSEGVLVLGEKIWEESELFARPFMEVMCSHGRSSGEKLKRIWNAIAKHIRKGEPGIEKLIGREIRKKFEEYDAVIVVSEASRLRTVVSRLQHPKKIQWIHTDYVLWSGFSGWTRMVTGQDARLYRCYDWIVSLSEHSRSGFVEKYPHLKEKTVVIPNLIDGDMILKKSDKEWNHVWKEGPVHLVTVGRTDREKAYDRVLDFCGKLRKDGFCFFWHIVGDGPLFLHLKKRIQDENLSGYVEMLGRLENPYPLMKKCDWLVLLSEYEGTPVTIDEAMVLGLPVAAVDVGGIREQLSGYGAGVILEREALYENLKNTVGKKVKAEPVEYKMRNERIMYSIEKLL